MADDEGRIARADRLVNEHAVDGWMGGNIHHVIDFADQFHREHGIKGDILEIGIHHGRLFFVLAAAARDDEACIAVDLFDNQALNIDHSGSGSKQVFLGLVETAFPDIATRLRLVEGDSMSVTVPFIRDRLGTDGVRLFSVDGGHTRLHAINDLVIAQELLVSGGMVLLDDFFGPHWPAVTEGFFEYMVRYNRRLAPVLQFENKLFLTTFSEHQMIQGGLHARMETVFGDYFPIKWKFTELCGFKVLSCS